MPEFLIPDIVDFGGLFVDGATPGLPRGCVALLAGPAGSGKTTFALATVRDLLKKFPNARLLYFTTEMTRDMLKNEFDQFGWFSDSDPTFTNDRFTHVQIPILGLEGTPAVETTTERLGELRSGEVFIIIDTVTAILLDRRNPAETRLALDSLIISIRRSFQNDLILAVLLAEQSSSTSHSGGLPPAEECAADAIFKLDLKDSGEGRRLRTLTVTKCRGANMRVGEHTFAIVTSASLNSVFAQDLTIARVRNATGIEPNDQRNWGTIIVSPRPRLRPIHDANSTEKDQTSTPPELHSGTPGLDALLNDRPNIWSDRQESHPPALYRRSTTLILGSAGTGKTIICLQFLLAEEDPTHSIYVNFENEPKDVIRMFPNVDLRPRLEKFHYLYRRRSNLDVNLWMLELIHAIETAGIKRIAIDGLSDLLATTGEQEYSRLVETLVKSIRHAGARDATLFLTYETMPQLDKLTPLAPRLSVLADNVVVLRQLAIEDEWRKTVYVPKARGLNPFRLVREIRISSESGDASPLVIQTGLESYANLLAGKPCPVKIVMQLFAENQAERRFNKRLTKELTAMFGYEVKSFGFSRPETIRAFEDAISSSSRVPPSDIRIISVDEWWIREYYVTPAGEPNPQHPLLMLDQFYESRSDPRGQRSHFSSSSDHWLFEIEKASVVRTLPSPGQDAVEASSRDMAVPLYMDYGMFCVNRSAFSEAFAFNEADPRSYIRAIPRVWTACREGVFLPARDQDPRRTLVGLMFDAKSRTHADFVGFAFDLETMESAVCTYLELCWAFGGKENFLIDDVLTASPGAEQSSSATVAVKFLQFLVREKLMPKRVRLQDSCRALFSRHWYSTLCDFCERDARTRNPSEPPPLVAVPFFPVGSIDLGFPEDKQAEEPVISALEDACERFHRIMGRVSAALRFRKHGDLTEFDAIQKEFGVLCETLKPCYAATDRQKTRNVIDDLRRFGAQLLDIAGSTPCLSAGWPVDNRPAERDVGLFLPAAKSMDVRDVRELLAWHDFRLKLIDSELGEDDDLASVAYGGVVPEMSHAGGGLKALTGYCCSGSWMVGALRPAHSPSIAWKVIEEITSRDQAVARATAGAGIPPRKDFFDFHGHEKVTHAPHLTWSNLLRFSGSRARRRDRIVCPAVSVSHVSALIYRLLMKCLDASESPEADRIAVQEVRSLFDYLRSSMEAK